MSAGNPPRANDPDLETESNANNSDRDVHVKSSSDVENEPRANSSDNEDENESSANTQNSPGVVDKAASVTTPNDVQQLPVTPPNKYSYLFSTDTPLTPIDSSPEVPKDALLDYNSDEGEEPSSPTPTGRSTKTLGTTKADVMRPPDRSHDWVTSLPFVKPDLNPNSSDLRTLHDLLRVIPREPPVPYKAGKLESMKDLTETELKLDAISPLRKIVYFPRLVSQLYDEAEAQLQAIPVNLSNPYHILALGHLHPWTTAKGRSNTVKSEKDVEAWASATIFGPGLGALHSVNAGSLEYDIHTEYPSISSAPFSNVIPDFRLMIEKSAKAKSTEDEETSVVVTTIEVKSHPAWVKFGFSEYQNLPQGVPVGTAMKFRWPTKDDGRPNEQTRLFVQVWTQMQESNCDLGIVCSSASVTFLARGRDDDSRDTLYISPSYERDMCPTYAAYCWFALATGRISQDKLKLPLPECEWWDEVRTSDNYLTVTGVVPVTMYRWYKAPATKNDHTMKTRSKPN